MREPLLKIEDLTIQYTTGQRSLTAASDVSFSVNSGEYFGLVGESGCGKTTIAKAIMGGLDRNGEITEGKIKYKGDDISNFSEKKLSEEIRWSEISWIPQGSMNSLDPLQRVRDQALEIADTHTDLSDDEALNKFREAFKVVGLPEGRINDYPHQFSGGMAQRAIIALAIFLRPSLIIADEPTTALDVIMQDQIFKYLSNIRVEEDISMVIITHDISVVFEECNSIAIMHSGQLAETGKITDVFDSPLHPYSMLLQKAFPDIRSPENELEVIPGDPPELYGKVDFCTFADRCPWAKEKCRSGAPPLRSISGDSDHNTGCIRAEEIDELISGARHETEKKS